MNRYFLLMMLIVLAWGQESEKIISRWDNNVIKKIHYYEGSGFNE